MNKQIHQKLKTENSEFSGKIREKKLKTILKRGTKCNQIEKTCALPIRLEGKGATGKPQDILLKENTSILAEFPPAIKTTFSSGCLIFWCHLSDVFWPFLMLYR